MANLNPVNERVQVLDDSVHLPISGSVLSNIYKNLNTPENCRAYLNNTYGGVAFDADLTAAMYGSGADRFIDSIAEAVQQRGAPAADTLKETKVLFSALNTLSNQVKGLAGQLRTVLAGYHAIGVVAQEIPDEYFTGKTLANLRAFATSIGVTEDQLNVGLGQGAQLDQAGAKRRILQYAAARSFKHGFSDSVALEAPVASAGSGPVNPAWAKSPVDAWKSIWGKSSARSDDDTDADNSDDDVEITDADVDDIKDLANGISKASLFDDNALSLSAITGVDIERAIENRKADIVLKKITQNPRLYRILNSLDADVLRKNSPLLALSLQEGDQYATQPEDANTRMYKKLLIRNKNFLRDVTDGKVGPRPFSENNVLKYLVPAAEARRSHKKKSQK